MKSSSCSVPFLLLVDSKVESVWAVAARVSSFKKISDVVSPAVIEYNGKAPMSAGVLRNAMTVDSGATSASVT